MARAPPNAPSTPSRKRFTFSPRGPANRARRSTRRPDRLGLDSGGLDIIAQRFLLGLVFPDPPLDDVADRNHADDPVALEHRQMPALAHRHYFHDCADGVGLPATNDLARHDRTDRLVKHASTAFAEHAHDVAFRQAAFHATFVHDQNGADLPFRQNLDRSRKLCVRLDALDLVAFGIENCTYRHCRLPEADRALERARSLFP